MALISCPECQKQVSSAAESCPSCGHPILGSRMTVIQAPQRPWNAGIAALLSLIIPGAGQMYKGQVGGGILWLVFTVLGYALFVVPGIALHLICIFTAANHGYTAELQRRQPVLKAQKIVQPLPFSPEGRAERALPMGRQ